MSRRTVLLGHGAGGRMTAELVESVLLPHLGNPALAALDDAAVLPELPPGRPAMTTDAFVVSPPVFPGGDVGSLSVTGTLNDLVMTGARPLWLSWALVLEEGTDLDLVERCAVSAGRIARATGTAIVAGDTKVVPRGAGDGIYAVTAGLGVVPPGRQVSDTTVRPGDAVLVTGPVGDHGATIMALRHGLETGDLASDCAPLADLLEPLWDAGIAIRALHDPTRGGLATVTAEVAERTGLQMVLEETAIPVRGAVQAVCELLGLDPLELACEGRAVLWVAAEDAGRAVDLLRANPQGSGAAVIGAAVERPAGGSPVVLRSRSGGLRPLDRLSGSGLPRIC